MSPEPFVRPGSMICACGDAGMSSTSPTASVEDVEEGDVIRCLYNLDESELDNDNEYDEDDEELVESSVSSPTPQSRSPLEGAADSTAR
ncbi:uncharacterized protein STEHIDRAFT_155070 [Stereum hirsutum FP-91666 SS1]|uniref:uncharacterized protein n=1 Tax=Stereum hirsutum (strain FP-91666) TaxID=721885 RepID=UPI000440F6AF|nr:uncharacterized protein STEHIDRAFT_155070 [Stereum hirsutum FP-91666 SS1]EIM89406.1 hypothetical protein STEHIDRAFT_155070 [Stereum hirsutum FP-91666 SS1]